MIRANALLIVPQELDADLKVRYNEWLESSVLLPLKNVDPASYESLVESTKAQIEKLVSENLLKGDESE